MISSIIFAAERFIAFALSSWFPFYFIENHKISDVNYIALESGFIALCYLSPIIATFIIKYRKNKILIASGLIYGISCALLTFSNLLIIFIGLFFISITSGLIKINTLSLIGENKEAVAKLGGMQSFINIFALISAISSPFILKFTGNISTLFYSLIMLFFVYYFIKHHKAGQNYSELDKIGWKDFLINKGQREPEAVKVFYKALSFILVSLLFAVFSQQYSSYIVIGYKMKEEYIFGFKIVPSIFIAAYPILAIFFYKPANKILKKFKNNIFEFTVLIAGILSIISLSLIITFHYWFEMSILFLIFPILLIGVADILIYTLYLNYFFEDTSKKYARLFSPIIYLNIFIGNIIASLYVKFFTYVNIQYFICYIIYTVISIIGIIIAKKKLFKNPFSHKHLI